ncbi:MAG: cell division protein FtsL [Cellvibrionaceae bacterium]
MVKVNINTSERVRRFNRNACVLVVLWLAVVVSGVGVAYTTHLSRQLFNELEAKRRVTGNLHVEWGQYLLEQSTWAAYGRVENIAADELDMRTPAHESIIIIRR